MNIWMALLIAYGLIIGLAVEARMMDKRLRKVEETLAELKGELRGLSNKK